MTRALMFALLATTALSGVAQAQAPAERSGGVEEVIVTAQKREQGAQTVGIALSVLSGADVVEKGVYKINALENFTPNLEIENQFGSGQVSFSIRGVGFRDYATNNASTVGVYVDEVAYTFPVMTQGVIFDVERIEVLRGPQGTLYGRNSTGGAINILSRRPTDEFTFGAALEYGNYNAFNAEGYVSGPVGDKVKARLAATTNQGGAWQVNRETGQKLGRADRFGVRGLIEFDPTPTFNVLLNLHYYEDESEGLGLRLFRDSPFVGPALIHQGDRQTSWGASPGFSLLNGIPTDQKPFRDNQGWGGSLRANANLGFGELTYIGSYESLDRREYNDYDAVTAGGAGVLFNSEIRVTTHELRLSSVDEGPLKWIGGVYYANERLNELYNSDFEATFGPIFAFLFGAPPGAPFGVSTPYKQRANTIGVFGQAEYRFNPMFNLVAGVRYEHEERDLKDLGTFTSYSGAFNFATGTTALANRSLDTDEVTGKIALEVNPVEDLLLYASFSRGIKSGGFTAVNTLNPRGADPFEPEKLYAYEVGFKSDFADRTVRLNGAVFYYDYRDQQIQSAIFDTASGAVVGKIVNAPKSRIWGAELELLWQPIEMLTISQSVGYKDGEFREFLDLNTAAPPALIDRSGQDIGFPKLSYQGSVTVALPVTEALTSRATVDYSFRDKQSFPLLGPLYDLDSYWLVNAQLALGPKDGPWEVAVWARNLFNERYAETRNTFLVGFANDIEAPGQVRTYGVRLNFKY